jgi:SAM-dependent methyltransferase
MEAIWTLDGDETSWSAWAETMADAPASPFMLEAIAFEDMPRKGWAVDLGCGTGRAFLPLSEAGYRVIGLDPTLQGIWLSQQRINRERIEAYPLLASAARVPLASESIAFILALSILFHLSQGELASALAEIRRLLLPGGKAVLHFLDREDWRRTLAREIPPEQAPVPGYRAVVTCFCSQGQIREWVAGARLRLVSLELKTSPSEKGQQRNWLAYCEKEAVLYPASPR